MLEGAQINDFTTDLVVESFNICLNTMILLLLDPSEYRINQLENEIKIKDT